MYALKNGKSLGLILSVMITGLILTVQNTQGMLIVERNNMLWNL